MAVKTYIKTFKILGWHHVKINNDFVDEDWLRQNCSSSFFNENDDWVFESIDDAVLAKLTWDMNASEIT